MSSKDRLRRARWIMVTCLTVSFVAVWCPFLIDGSLLSLVVALAFMPFFAYLYWLLFRLLQQIRKELER